MQRAANWRRVSAFLLAIAALFIFGIRSGWAEEGSLAGMRQIRTSYGFADTVQRLEKAVDANGMLLLSKASASTGAAARGITIPGNAVLFVFRNDFAVRVLKASVAAGIEAPLRLYVTEETDGKALVSYRLPSAVFAPYGRGDLATLSAELDRIFAKIVDDAIRP
jgi:uncharacterized protein (DUF302 family)